jgi:signal transduction histidine kinase/class 3 adenylate cyclase
LTLNNEAIQKSQTAVGKALIFCTYCWLPVMFALLLWRYMGVLNFQTSTWFIQTAALPLSFLAIYAYSRYVGFLDSSLRVRLTFLGFFVWWIIGLFVLLSCFIGVEDLYASYALMALVAMSLLPLRFIQALTLMFSINIHLVIGGYVAFNRDDHDVVARVVIVSFCFTAVGIMFALNTARSTQRRKQLRKARLQSEEQARQLAQLDEQKTVFFQNMSHELRTPLTLILNPLESATKRLPGDKDIEVAAKNSRRLLRLVNQLLDFQKLEAGKQELKLAPVDLSRFTYICGDYFASACSSKDVRFSATVNAQSIHDKTKSFYIQGEVDALEKVTFNFLSNALKYTPKGGEIELGLTTTADKARVYIRDNGPGISKEGQEKLFQVFSQVDETTTRDYEGTGLGLALVKSLTEEMQGKVGVESQPGQGSTFWAEFPLCEAPEQQEDLNFKAKDWLLADGGGQTGIEDTGVFKALEEISEGAGELVLVVDDLPDMRDLISNSLKKKNYRVATAPNGKRGVEIAHQIKPNLIITDWMMPVMSGPDLIQEVKASGNGLSSVPIILLTAKSDEESKLIGTEIGADAFLGKPFNDQELGSMVRNLLSLKTREREVEDLNKLLTESVLKRYLPPDLVDQIVSGETSLEQEPKATHATILFSDLVGFTTLSDKIRAKKMARVLNEYLSVMTDVIYEFGGTIDKFIGDAIMVVFGAPTPMIPELQSELASQCALAMQGAMDDLNRKWVEDSIPELKMRIGIHHGPVVVGTFGSDKRSDYTAIGPTVNMASRIESVCGPGEVFISGEVCDYLDEAMVKEAGQFELKGLGELNLYKLS